MSENALTEVRTYDDGRFVRTALVGTPHQGGSIDIIDASGTRLAQVNIFVYPSQSSPSGSIGKIIVDVIDVDKRYEESFAMVMHNGNRKHVDGDPDNRLVSADFTASWYKDRNSPS